MGKTIFKNFDPENLYDAFNKPPFIEAWWLKAYIHAPVVLCGIDLGYPFMDSEILINAKARFPGITNADFTDLAKRISALARIGIQNKNTSDFADMEDSWFHGIERTCLIAMHGRTIAKDSDVTYVQIYALSALKHIDSALTSIATDGINLEVCRSISSAAQYLGHAFGGRTGPQLDEQLKKMVSQQARGKAEKLHEETHALRDEVVTHWRDNISPALSAPKAADILLAYFPLSHRTLAAYIRQEKKKIPQ